MTAHSSVADFKGGGRQENLRNKEDSEESKLEELRNKDIVEDNYKEKVKLVVFCLSPCDMRVFLTINFQ